MFGEIFAMWGCIPELTRNCIDMTNAGSTYFGFVMGAILGAIISWWIYYRQKKISDEQDNLLSHLKELEENNEIILQRVEYYQEKHEKLLRSLLSIEKKIDSVLEKNL
jgi:type II secretory pathway component PulF